MIENTELLDEIIIGYVPHKIYAFSTPQLEDYLKVGETSRSVIIRLSEWQKKINDLQFEKDWLAMLPKDSEEQKHFFQDYALHQYFKEQGFQPKNYAEAPGNSKEFYPVTTQIMEDGIEAINRDYSDSLNNYTYLSIEDNSVLKQEWKRIEVFKPRENQQAVIDNIVNVSKDTSVRTNYLLFAVMRFGKTFVALEAAKALDSKLTVVVSAKADVKGEWKKSLESHKDFDGYRFLDSDSLTGSSTAIQDVLDSNERVVLFLTLQDLIGNNIKSKHKQLFEKKVDFLIVDESHFGARAQSYGQVIHKWVGSGKTRKLKTVDAYEEQVTDDEEGIDEVEGLENVKSIDASYTLHLSGTPYRILMGSEFEDSKQIVGKVQFEDILEEKAKWYEDHLEEPEWKNPYFGFPQMIRFAFNLSDTAMSKLNTLTTEGKTSRLDELFGPRSNEKTDKEHKKFKHEGYVLEILQALDGSKDSKTIFPVINYYKIKEGKMAHHIVMVLPYKASCDAMASLLATHKDDFFNLGNYDVINIAGHDSTFNNQGKPATEKVKAIIEKASKEGKKTISLTVNKMLTGVTVPQWDTMLFLKDTQSPQEYDQAIYRLQSPYVTKQFDEGKNLVNKEDLKPQTLLIDFSPNRMMSIEQYKAFVFSASEGTAGNDNIGKSLERQINFSPIITLNAERLTQVKPADVLKYVAAYSSEKGIIEEANEIHVDLSILNNSVIKAAVEQENELGSKSGLKFNQHENGEEETGESGINSEDGDTEDEDDSNSDSRSTPSGDESSEEEKLAKKVQNYYLRILFYAFLSEETSINSLTDVVESYDENVRLASHIGLEKGVLNELSKELTNPFVRSDLDNKISNANALLADDSIKPGEKVARAIQSFKRISDSEVFTPRKVTEMMVDKLLDEVDLTTFNENPVKFIDIASKSGIYLLVLFEKLMEKGVDESLIKENLFAVTTSPIAYEFTRKMYELLGFPLVNVLDIEWASSYDMIKPLEREYVLSGLNQYFFKGDENMKFDVVVGNPPYQDEKTTNNRKTPIYPYFYDLAAKLSNESALISPARFLFNAGLTSKAWNKKMLNDEHIKVLYYEDNAVNIFPNTDIKGGVAIVYRNKNKRMGPIGQFIKTDEIRALYERIHQKSFIPFSTIMIGGRADFLMNDKFHEAYPSAKHDLLKAIQETAAKKGNNIPMELAPGSDNEIVTSTLDVLSYAFVNEKPNDNTNYIKVAGIINNKRVSGYVNRDYLSTRRLSNNNIDFYKVFIPKSMGSGKFGESISEPLIGEPGTTSTPTYLRIGMFNSREEAENCCKFIKSKFCRALLGIRKITQDNPVPVWENIPLEDFSSNSDINWTRTISEIDQQLYRKYGFSQVEIDFVEEKVKAME
ncbi:Eco57I restriction-modification methylase domain-containing protein [Enterococcus faecalis]|uniref:Eco57I restriction-modification methylase domain-containing protein n=1 Tax=Enterococcus faecalis TaxID=1351 RepID=UPI001038D332|nr:Eco57I restriction-modification methylase domain-containing protein [Enterococcus faecalis]EGO5824151.1 DEAD/DEAH box helicase family protein [Enterococcus faecalis]EGO6731117.1 DEAD/DEAH box helicase family protein [Enterococcus faecalis]EJV6888382.1 Eco57I restriction-modification methylase domain-containing protein [Enterococcus faecalis]HAP5734166.1 DEAD/DEAH box helicase family protein [Enterococcus faecalis]